MFAISNEEASAAERNRGALAGISAMSSGSQRIRFIRGTIMDAERSAAGGTWEMGHVEQGAYKSPIYLDAVMVAIVDPDPPHDETVREATQTDYRQYARQWEQSQRVMDLTPLHYLPGVRPSQLEMAKSAKIHWVQHIAEKTEDELCAELRPLLMTAKQYLMIAAGQKPRVKLVAA